MEVLLYILGCYGITMLIVQSKIMEPIRDFFKTRVKFMYNLLHCMMCTGFWVGLISGFVFDYSPFSNLSTAPMVHIFDAGFISGCIWLIYLIQLNLEKDVKDEI